MNETETHHHTSDNYRDIDWQRVAEDALKKAAAAEQRAATPQPPSWIGLVSFLVIVFASGMFGLYGGRYEYEKVTETFLVTGSETKTFSLNPLNADAPRDHLGRKFIVAKFTEIEQVPTATPPPSDRWVDGQGGLWTSSPAHWIWSPAENTSASNATTRTWSSTPDTTQTWSSTQTTITLGHKSLELRPDGDIYFSGTKIGHDPTAFTALDQFVHRCQAVTRLPHNSN